MTTLVKQSTADNKIAVTSWSHDEWCLASL